MMAWMHQPNISPQYAAVMFAVFLNVQQHTYFFFFFFFKEGANFYIENIKLALSACLMGLDTFKSTFKSNLK